MVRFPSISAPEYSYLTLTCPGQTLSSTSSGKLAYTEDSAAFTADTVCWIASMTKLMTTTSVLQLVHRGKVGLDDDVGQILPQLRDKDVLTGFDGEGKPILEKQKKAITLR